MIAASEPARTAPWALPWWFLIETLAALVIYAACVFSIFRRPRLRDGSAGTTPVLLVHGFTMNEGALWLLAARLRTAGCGPVWFVRYAPWSAPSDACAQISDAARELATLTGRRTVDVVGHSLGGSLAHAAREQAQAGSIGRIVSLSAVHRPSWFGRLPIGPMAKAIPKQAPAWGRTGDLAITSDADFFIRAAWAYLLPPARTTTLDRVGHTGLLLDPRAAHLTSRHLLQGASSSVRGA